MSGSAQVKAWRPGIGGVVEVLHAYFPSHAYPSHTHDAWTVLIVDEGVVRYDLDHREHGLAQAQVSLLPPNVPHDGRSVRPEGFRKRVLYLEPDRLGAGLVGAAVDQPELVDPVLRHRIHQLHGVLADGQEDLEAQSRLALIEERLEQHLRRRVIDPPDRRDAGVARRLREVLDGHLPAGLTLDEAAELVHAHPTHLVRAFSREYGMPPHRYLTGRRVDLARRYLLDGRPATEVATLAGFYDQSHLTRHFRKMLGVTPGQFVKP
ncbi:AraC family transcriptional regulator [Kribbella qitaiheensis]|uniref:AraC family transcriptional regulator n=1 Tax=Kribbella qitaiheensis TaxID=1544730 RepID=A0A7G6X3J5_9ACTN|nr:AraC family transcriptional regulator [Kribbella qitaiheensis]QNE20810.1 AraC family transcriptional regulator [Kribbella qitaiheensis]